VEESVGPGHGGAFVISAGRLDKVDAELKLMDSVPALNALVGNPRAAQTEVLCVAVATDGDRERKESWTLRGLWRSQTRNVAGGGEKNVEYTYAVNVRTLTHRIDGDEVRHIDLVQDIHRIDGADVNAERRASLRTP